MTNGPQAPTFFRSGHNGAINDPVGLSFRQALDLGNVEVGVDFGCLIFSLGVVRQDTSARLEIR